MGKPPIIAEHTMNDEVLINAVRDALNKYDPARIWGDDVKIDARGGTVTLSGIVRSQTTKETAGKMASQVNGVSAVQNNLMADADLEMAVAQALAADPRTHPAFPGVLVGVVFGVVYLKGMVKTPEIKAAIGQVAAQVPGVRTVSNEVGTVQSVKAEAAKGGKPEAAVRPA
jgi:osmotically-inducible protein OsmY